MTDLVTLQARLAEAETALHQVVTQQRAVSVEYDGRKVSYSMANVGNLRAYVAELRDQVARLTGTRRRRAFRVTFGG
jgi:hypothetical protein